MKKNDWILIISVILYSWMFYQQSPGINILLFPMRVAVRAAFKKRLDFCQRERSALKWLLRGLLYTLHGIREAVRPRPPSDGHPKRLQSNIDCAGAFALAL